MMGGFGWEIGAFESWDALGVAKTTETMKAAGFKVAAWVDEMIAAGNHHFIKLKMAGSCVMMLASKHTNLFRWQTHLL